jgi:hypothetical protein
MGDLIAVTYFLPLSSGESQLHFFDSSHCRCLSSSQNPLDENVRGPLSPLLIQWVLRRRRDHVRNQGHAIEICVSFHLPLKAHWGRGGKVPPLRPQCTCKETRQLREEAILFRLVFRHRLSLTHTHTMLKEFTDYNDFIFGYNYYK